MNFLSRLFGKKTPANEWPADVMALNAVPNDTSQDDDDVDDPARFEDITGTEEDASDFLSAWGYPGYDFQTDKKSSVGRIFFIDGEDLADYGVEFQLNECQPYLIGQDLPSLTVVETESDARYILTVNDRQVVIYDGPGPSSEAGASKDPAIWFAATVQLIRILNWLLETANSPERAYVTKPGTTDAVLVFLTADLFQRLSNEPNLAVDERPVDYGSLDHPVEGQISPTASWSVDTLLQR